MRSYVVKLSAKGISREFTRSRVFPIDRCLILVKFNAFVKRGVIFAFSCMVLTVLSAPLES